MYDQHAALPALKRERPQLATVHSQVLQNVAVRLDLAFRAFFRRVRAGEKPGFPRFRGAGRCDSFCYPQSGFAVDAEHDTVTLSKIGVVKVVVHRPIEGRIKTCCVKRSSTGKWYVTISCDDVPADRVPESTASVGIDVGLTHFATLSTDEHIANPRFFRTDERALAKAQRRLSRAAKGTPKRAKRRKPVARIHERIRFRRHDFAHQTARRIVNRFGAIAVENLAVNRMVHNHCLAKSIHDAAWGQFTAILADKAACAGRSVVAVNPAYTSQDCSRCGHRQPMPLGERVYRCRCCGLEMDRDQNAALNIVALGQQSLGRVPRSSRL
ncbi:MAG: RNA-guided endonuclease InsQ/TnpB family protein [Dehalococcoidia bacterium]